MKVLVIGSGAREHGLVAALRRDPEVTDITCAPGNPGMCDAATCLPLEDVTDAEAILALAHTTAADLVVIGPEAPLVAGAGDLLRSQGFAVFGPDAAAARLEGSKAYAKEVMAAADVPTAFAHVCETLDEAADALEGTGAPFVVKDDGLAAGKGVVVTSSHAQAFAFAAQCLGRDGHKVVIEEYLDGPEVSVFVLCDGRSVLPLAPSQDFKRVRDGDDGPNTGGMGAYCPLPWQPEDLVEQVTTRIAQPVVDEMARRGTPYVGALYVGLAMTARGPRVVEFNCRFGDPDSQVVLARLAAPLGQLLRAAATGRLDEVPEPGWLPDAAVNVVLAAKGYPEKPLTGHVITGIEDAAAQEGVTVLHAGTKRADDGTLRSAGGRVLNVVARGETLAQARDRAYDAIGRIHLDGSHYRTDIARAAVDGTVTIPTLES